MNSLDQINKIWNQVKEFDWDKGNVNKNLEKHKITVKESEEIFFNEPFLTDLLSGKLFWTQRFMVVQLNHYSCQ